MIVSPHFDLSLCLVEQGVPAPTSLSLTKLLLTLGPSSCGNLLIWLYVVLWRGCGVWPSVKGGDRYTYKTPIGEVQSQQSVWAAELLKQCMGFCALIQTQKGSNESLLSLLGHCDANSLPSTEQAVKTKLRQDKPFSFIFHHF